MSEALTAVVVATITGLISLTGTIITVLVNGKFQKDALAQKIDTQLKVYSAATDVKIDELTREVREHNNFARRMPVVENEIENIHKEIKEIKEDMKE